MFQAQFILQNAHFALSLLGAFMFFAVSWLYFDAWLVKKYPRESFKFLGFLLLSFAFLMHATFIEQSILHKSLLPGDLNEFLTTVFKMAGYVFLIVGLATDPLQEHPDVHKEKKLAAITLVSFPLGVSFLRFSSFIFPVLSAVVGLLYLRRATLGLEAHLRRVSVVFFILSFSEVLALSHFFRDAGNVTIFNTVSPFGPLWMIEHSGLVLSALLLRKWVFQYLLTRIQTQLFMIFTTIIVVIFLLTTITFTSLLITSVQKDALSHLKTDVSVLQYAIDSKKQETLSDAQMVSGNQELKKALLDRDRRTLRDVTGGILFAKNQTFLVVLGSKGEVLMRAEDPERVGESFSDDSFVRRVLSGESLSTVMVRDGVLAPQLSIRSAVPVKSGKEIVGAVLVGSAIDNAFVDGIKHATGLESAVYADNTRSATTFVAPDGKSRWVGVKEETEAVKRTVLDEGKVYTGFVNIFNRPFLAAYAPLHDVDSNPMGMLFVGKEQVGVLQTAGGALESTFLTSALLILLSVIPAFFISRSIAHQVQ